MVETENYDDDSVLLQRLREWQTHRKDYEFDIYLKRAQWMNLDNLDPAIVKIMVMKL